MPPEVARDLSVPDLLRALNEKLSLECAWLQASPWVSVALLESEIANIETRAHEILRCMSSLRNTLQPINRIPPEVLSQIAQWIPDSKDPDLRSIIPLTHVCQYWRSSIISAPGNWTRISSRSKPLAALTLERSKAAPLRISFWMYDVEEQSGFSDILAPYIRNITTIKFFALMDLEDLIQTLPNFPRSTPNLQSLELSRSGEEDDPDISIDPFQPFPSTLRRLALFYIPLYPTFLNLRTLTDLTLCNFAFPHPLDTLLTMLEENRSLERVNLCIKFTNPDLHTPQRRAPISNRLQHLSVSFYKVEEARPLISSIPIQRGANLELNSRSLTGVFNDTLSSIPATHFANLQSPTYMNIRGSDIRLSGPNGSFSLSGLSPSEMSFVGLPLLSFDKIRELHFNYPPRAFNPPLFPALETLAIEHDATVTNTLSIWLSSPKSSPLLKTLAFLNCDLSEGFMELLTEFARNRRNTAVTWLYRVLIVNNGGEFPSPPAIHKLRDYVKVVDVQMADSLPSNLT